MQHMQCLLGPVTSAFCFMVPPPSIALLPCNKKTRAHHPEMPLLASPIWSSTWQVGQGKSPCSIIASFQLLFLSWTLTGGGRDFMPIRWPPMACHMCYQSSTLESGPVCGPILFSRCSRIAPD
ncbi:hypothetical protein LY76DRAFT_147820 [Colletotrichum caudatum]|nr:hypothetical protein LY76DRAFT_147820 [Colletotrichum caudatum]